MEIPTKFRSVSAGFRYWLLALVLLAFSTILVSCGGDETTITESGRAGDTSFELTFFQNVTSGGTTPITAYVTKSVVLDDGTDGTIAASGVTVTFQIIDNQSGSFLNPVSGSVVTGVDGRASVTFNAGTTSVAITDTVRVRITNVDPQDALITVNPPGTGTITVTVSATPDALEAVTDAGADNQATILATVTSAAGALANKAVNFSTTAGTLCTYPNCAAPYDPLNPPQTDGEGKARIILQSSTNLETAVVEAEVDTVSGSTTVTFIAGPASSFELFASPTNLRADGNSASTVTTVVTDSAGHLVVDDTTVNFSIKNTSTGGGTLVNATTGFPPATGETVGGVATATFIAGTTVGTLNIRASSGGVDSDDVDPTYGDGLITLIPEFVGSVSMVVDPSTLTADGASKAQAIATVLNSDGLPVNAGTSVTFTTSGGDLDTDFNFSNPLTSVTTATLGDLGEAAVFLRSSTTAGQNFVTATAGGRSGAAQVNFIAGVADAGNSALTVSPTLIDADGSSTATMTLTAQDSIGNPVADGKTVGFSANDPGVVISNQTTTTNGIATATLTSTNTPGTVTLSAAIDTIIETTTINFGIAGGADPNTINLVLSDTFLTVESPTGSDAITIQATVFDGSDPPSPIGVDCNNNITFTKVAGPVDVTLDGSLTPVTKTTNGGVASVILNAGITPGTVRVQVTASQDTGNCSSATPTTVSVTSTAIIIASGPAANLFLSPDSDVIDEPDSSLTSRIYNAIVSDQYGNPVVDDTAVSFSLGLPAPAGVQVCPTGYTGIATTGDDCAGPTTAFNGVARTKLSWPPELIWSTFTLNAETSGGTVTDQLVNVTFPAVADVSITVDTIPASVTLPATPGTVSVTVVATYEDGSGPPNPIQGRTVTFTSSDPGLVSVDNPTDVTDVNGQAFTTLTVNCTATTTDTSVTITAAEVPYFGEGTLSVTCP
jgi:hypothetical protein